MYIPWAIQREQEMCITIAHTKQINGWNKMISLSNWSARVLNEALGFAAIYNMQLGTAKQLSWLKKIMSHLILGSHNASEAKFPYQFHTCTTNNQGRFLADDWSLPISTDAKDIGNCDSYDLQFLNMELRNTLDKSCFCVTIIKISIPFLQ